MHPMTLSLPNVLIALAFICFALAVPPLPWRINLVALGLAFWALDLLVTGHLR